MTNDIYRDPLVARDLLAFVGAVDMESVHRAAGLLNVTQSTVTKRVQALEQRLGLRLLERGSFGVRPTEAGRNLYPEARRALVQLERARRVVGDPADGEAQLRISTSHTIGGFLLPRWLSAFRADNRGARAHVEVAASPDVLSAVRENRADIGFVEGNDREDDVATLTLLRDEIVVVVAAGHPWATRGQVTTDQLSGEAYLTREEGSGTRAVVTAALAAHGVTLEPTVETTSLENLKRVVRDGGFTLISRVAIEDEDARGELRAIPLAGIDLRREFRAVRLRKPSLASTPARFWACLEQFVDAELQAAPRIGPSAAMNSGRPTRASNLR